MPRLRYVNLSGNASTRSALGFWKSSELQELKLDSTSIDGSLNISDLAARGLLSMRTSNSSGKLRVLSLVNNSITDVIYDVTKIGDVTTIIRKGLAQHSADLDGLIPEDAFQNLTQLVQLELSHNRFHGTPPNLSSVTSLEVLDLSSNNFSGTLPDLTTMAGLRSVN